MPAAIVLSREEKKVKERAAALTNIWADSGSQRFSMQRDTMLWHGGTVSKTSELDDSRSLWCTCDPSNANYYDGSARENSQIGGLRPYRLTLATEHSLELANFCGASLLLFTNEYCDYQHNRMKIALRDWCLANSFDGVLNINRGPSEVVVCRPAHNLRIVQAIPL